MRPVFHSWFVTGFLAVALPAVAAERHNILLLFADDQRADTIAALGNPVIRTPNLDRLVRGGLVFNRAYMQGAFQGATCVPSRAMLLSGQSLFRVDERLMRDPTWPAAFGKEGYTTFLTGKWHNGTESVPASFRLARSVFLGGMTNPLKAPLADMVDGRFGGAKTTPGKHACETFADEAIRFLREHRDGPFFCYVPFNAPHDPHVVPEGFGIRYDPASIPLPGNFLPRHPWDNGELGNRDESLLPTPREPGRVQAFLAEYYRYISYLDTQVGRVLDALAASPHASNTIVVYAADSGVARGSHGLIGKQNLYEHSVRVPLILAGPGMPAGRRTDALCYLFDLLPTLGARCGVGAPRGSEGIDLGEVLRDPGKAGRAELVLAYRDMQRAIVTNEWKLIFYPRAGKAQLFHLREDPGEIRDLSGDPAHASRVEELAATMERVLQESGDRGSGKKRKPRGK